MSDDDEMQRALETATRSALWTCRQYRWPRDDWDDAIQAACLRVLEQGPKFAHTKARFGAIDWSRLEYGRSFPGRPGRARRTVHLGDMVDEDGNEWEPASPEPQIDSIEPDLSERLYAAIDHLPPRQRLLVVETFFGGRTLADLGRELGFTESRASQLRKQAIKSMHRRMRGDFSVTDRIDSAKLARDIGRCIRLGREQKGWSQGKLATLAGFDQSTLSAYERGVQTISDSRLAAVARVLDTTPGDLGREPRPSAFPDSGPKITLTGPPKPAAPRPVAPVDGLDRPDGKTFSPEPIASPVVTFTPPPDRFQELEQSILNVAATAVSLDGSFKTLDQRIRVLEAIRAQAAQRTLRRALIQAALEVNGACIRGLTALQARLTEEAAR